MFDAARGHRIALADAAIACHLELGHDEHADALGAGRSIGQARQHQMHDVLAEIVIARGDEDLGAGNPEAAILVGLGLGAHQAEIGTAVGLGQAHGAGPFAAENARNEHLALPFLAMMGERIHGASGEQRIGTPGHVGGFDHLLEDIADALGHALAAILRISAQAGPAALDEAVIGLLEGLGRGDRAAFLVEMTAFLVPYHIGRREYLLAELGAFLKDGFDQFPADFFAAGQLRIDAGGIEDVKQHKTHIGQRSGVVHESFLSGAGLKLGLADRGQLRQAASGRIRACPAWLAVVRRSADRSGRWVPST